MSRLVTGALGAGWLVLVAAGCGGGGSGGSSVPSVPPPEPLGFTLTPAVVASGATSSLDATYVHSNGETATADHGVGPMASGAAVTSGALRAPTAFTVSFQNLAGQTYTWQRTVSVANQPGSVPITSSLQPRWCHQAILLSSGKYLLAGGAWSDARAELFDPATRTFAYTGAMSTVRLCPSVTKLGNGKVLVAGGWSPSSAPEGTADLYDPATGQFTATGALQGPRSNHAAVLLGDGKVLLVGGKNGRSTLATAEVYDPVTGHFTAVGSMSVTSGRGVTAIRLGSGKVLVFGQGATQAELYDPATQQFGGTITLHGHRSAGALLQDGRVLLPGGVVFTGPSSATFEDTAEIYDPGAGTASLLAARLAKPRAVGTCALLSSGKVALLSGLSGAVIDTSVELFDPAGAGTFIPAGGLQWAHSQGTTAVLAGDRILATGGQFRTGDTETDDGWRKLYGAYSEIYDPSGASVVP